MTSKMAENLFGKSQIYLDLNFKFKSNYKEEAKKYLDKTLGELRDSNSGKHFCLLKRLGSQPPEQAANRIDDHFTVISQTFPPLSIELLPNLKIGF